MTLCWLEMTPLLWFLQFLESGVRDGGSCKFENLTEMVTGWKGPMESSKTRGWYDPRVEESRDIGM